MKMILANGNRVHCTADEMGEFITALSFPLPNPYWRYSELLSEDEVLRFLKGESTPEELKKVARYILIFTECLSFSAYLFDKSEGHPDQGKEFNMPVLNKLRKLYRDGNLDSKAVHKMEHLCLEIGADPL